MSIESYIPPYTEEQQREIDEHREARKKEREEAEQAEWDRLKALPWHEYIVAVQGHPPVSIKAQYYSKDKEGDLRLGTYVTSRWGSTVAHFAPGTWLFVRIVELPEGLTQ